MLAFSLIQTTKAFSVPGVSGLPVNGQKGNVLGPWAIEALLQLLSSATAAQKWPLTTYVWGNWLYPDETSLTSTETWILCTSHVSQNILLIFLQPFKNVKSILSFVGYTKTGGRPVCQLCLFQHFVRVSTTYSSAIQWNPLHWLKWFLTVLPNVVATKHLQGSHCDWRSFKLYWILINLNFNLNSHIWWLGAIVLASVGR